MNIIGLGNAGCEITKKFEKYTQYECYYIDVGATGSRAYNFPPQETSEEYESKVPNFKKFFKDIKGETLFIVAGGGAISCASLRILEQLNSEDTALLYIQPEIELLNGIQAQRQRVVMGVLQQYARSGLLKRMFLVSNPILEKIIGEVPIMGYYDQLNEVLASTLHMIHVFKKSKAVIGKIEQPRTGCRISTFGIYNSQKNSENLFFSLDNSKDLCYIYGINKDKLEQDGTLFRMIVNQMKGKVTPGISVSYAVFPTSYEDDIVYAMAHTSQIQP